MAVQDWSIICNLQPVLYLGMKCAPEKNLTSTVSGLSDNELLSQTRKLARLEQQVQVFVIDHLREVDTRGLYLQRGYGTIFEYAVRDLGYSDAAAWRRMKAMELCEETDGARDLLQDGLISLSTAAELQSAFDRQKRSAGLVKRSVATGPGPVATRAGSAPPASDEPPAPKLVLDDAGRQKLVEDSVGKSARQVKQMLADLDPGLAVPADRIRAMSGGRWELKAVIDDECRRGLEQLKGLLSHVDPQMTLGQLVGRLVREGLDRHDPSRPPRRRRSGSRPTDTVPTSTSKAEALSDKAAPSTAKPSARHAEDVTSTSKSAPKHSAQPEHHRTSASKVRTPSSRAIPAGVKRQVWERDDGRCRFVDPQTGRRCNSRHLLQIDHIFPFALGGAAEPENLRLLCFAHHRYRHQRRGCPHEPSAPEHPAPSPPLRERLPNRSGADRLCT